MPGVTSRLLNSIDHLLGRTFKSATDMARGGNEESIYKAVIPNFLYRPPFGYPRNMNVPEVRRLARTPYVEMILGTVINEVAHTKWDIVSKPGMDAPQEHIDDVSYFFENPNSYKENFKIQLRKIVRDILILDAGVWNKVFSRGGMFSELYARDGGTFTMNPDVFGTFFGKDDIMSTPFVNEWMSLPMSANYAHPDQSGGTPYGAVQYVTEKAAYYQYGWMTAIRPMPFGTRELVYVMMNPRTDSIYGQSPMEVLMDTVQMLLYGIDFYMDYYTNNNIPKGMISLDKADLDAVRKFKEQLQERTRAKDYNGDWKKSFWNVPVTNVPATFIPFQFTAEEIQLITQQEWFTKILMACFGVTPSEIGFTQDSNRATEIVQSKIFRRKLIRPLLDLIEYHINQEIVSEFKFGVILQPRPGEKSNKIVSGIEDVMFKFDTYDIEEDRARHEIYEIELRNNIRTINEIREEEGMGSISGGDELRQANPFMREYTAASTDDEYVFKKGTAAQEPIDVTLGEAQQMAGKYGFTGSLEQLRMGISVESEHAGTVGWDIEKFAQIAMDHLREDPEYYSKLKKMESKTQDVVIMECKNTTCSGKTMNAREDEKKHPLASGEFEVPSTYKDMKKEILSMLEKNKKAVMEMLDTLEGEDRISEIKALPDMIEKVSGVISSESIRDMASNIIRNAFYKSVNENEITLNMNFVPAASVVDFLQKAAMGSIKDMTEEIKNRIRQALTIGVKEGKSIRDLKYDVAEIFAKSEPRAEAIARSEVNTAENRATYETISQSGLKGMVEWVSVLDEDTSQICRSLNGQTVRPGKKFMTTAGGGWEGFHPAAHPNCRSTIVFHPE